MINRENLIYFQLKERIKQKYITDDITARLWITEYYKYIWIFSKIREKSFPSRIVEYVWNTHLEFWEAYRKFSIALFGRIIYPYIYHLLEEWNDDLIEYYRSTLREYEDMFCWTPPVQFWESEDIRFDENKMRTLWFNIYRLVIMLSIKVFDDTFLNFPKDSASVITVELKDVIQTGNVKSERWEWQTANKKYLWREKFKHWWHIYMNETLEEGGDIEISKILFCLTHNIVFFNENLGASEGVEGFTGCRLY